MIRTLIAEDELPLLRGLGQLIEKLHPAFEVVCEAKNGREALEYLSQHSVDVLFTDINMPVFNGLQLMEQARALCPQLQIVVISGYHDFEYARQAMRFGAKNYLLKPVNRAELKELLDSLSQEMTLYSYSQKRSWLIECLFNAGEEKPPLFPFKPLTVLYLCLGARQTSQDFDELSKPGAISDTLMWEMVKEKWGCPDIWLFYGQRPNEAIWIFEKKMEIALTDVQELIRRRFQADLPVTAAVCTDISSGNLQRTAAELSRWIANGVIMGQSRLLHSCPSAQSYHISAADKAAVHFSLQKRQWDEFFILVQRMLDSLLRSQGTQTVLEDFLTELLEMVHKEAGNQPDRELRATVQELVSTSGDEQALLRAFFPYCRDLFQHTTFDTSDKEGLMQSLDQYILEHIGEPLSLKELSQKYGLVAPYLSKLFKAYKGMSPAQYIQNIRIESAKRMLRDNPSMLSREIAEALGYSNALYFSKTFYKHVGVYPSEYRQTIRQRQMEPPKQTVEFSGKSDFR